MKINYDSDDSRTLMINAECSVDCLGKETSSDKKLSLENQACTLSTSLTDNWCICSSPSQPQPTHLRY